MPFGFPMHEGGHGGGGDARGRAQAPKVLSFGFCVSSRGIRVLYPFRARQTETVRLLSCAFANSESLTLTLMGRHPRLNPKLKTQNSKLESVLGFRLQRATEYRN